MPAIKPSISFISNNNNSDLALATDNIVQAMTGNPYYPTQDSGITQVATLNATFKTAIANAVDGGKSAFVALRAARAALVTRMRTLAYYVQLHCQNDLGILISSGFPAQKTTRTPATVPPTPQMQTLAMGPNSGTVFFKVFALGAATYQWRYALVSAPDDWTDTMPTTAANTSFSGLTPVTLYQFQCRAINSAGMSDWSLPYPLVVT